MARQKLIILPKLCNCNGDPSRQWFVYYSVRDPKTGKMHRFRHYDGFTELSAPQKLEHARKVIEHYALRLRTGWTPFTDDVETIYNDHLDYKSVAEMYGTKRAGNRTLRVTISGFLENISPAVSRSTYQTYQSKLRIFNLWIEKQKINDNDISSHDNQLLCLFFRYIINDRKLSGKSTLKYRELLFKFFDYCKSHELILINPVYNIPPCTRINDQAPRPIMRADIDIFKKELIKDPELWLAVQFEYYCALRPGHEIREMKIKDIDFIAGTVYVNRARSKNRHERTVTIPSQFLLQLRQFYDLRKYDREFYVFGRGGIPGPVHISKNKLGRKFNVIRKRLNMPSEYKFYSWKHTAAVEVDEAMIPAKDLSRHYGHSSLGITDIYLRNKKGSVSGAIRDNYPTL